MGDGPAFFAGFTIQELASKQGATPLRDIAELAGLISADEAAEFLAAIHESDGIEVDRVSD